MLAWKAPESPPDSTRLSEMPRRAPHLARRKPRDEAAPGSVAPPPCAAMRHRASCESSAGRCNVPRIAARSQPDRPTARPGDRSGAFPRARVCLSKLGGRPRIGRPARDSCLRFPSSGDNSRTPGHALPPFFATTSRELGYDSRHEDLSRRRRRARRAAWPSVYRTRLRGRRRDARRPARARLPPRRQGLPGLPAPRHPATSTRSRAPSARPAPATTASRRAFRPTSRSRKTSRGAT